MRMDIFNHILTISTSPTGKGGIASVIKVYKDNIYPFKHIASTTGEGSYSNIIKLIVAIFQVIFIITLDKSIRIVHIHSASYRSFHRKYLFFIIAKKIFRKRVIFHVHGAVFHLFYNKANKRLKKKIRYLIEGADLVICLSQEWKDYFLSNFNPKQIEILNNIIDKPDLSKIDLKNKKVK
jgi:glycosyltransferase involved in cell wall biosynthesis